MALLAIAHEAAADEVGAVMDAAQRLGHYMVKGGAAVELVAAVGALIVPCEMDLIARRFAGDKLRLFNPVFHRPGQATGKRKRRGQ